MPGPRINSVFSCPLVKACVTHFHMLRYKFPQVSRFTRPPRKLKTCFCICQALKLITSHPQTWFVFTSNPNSAWGGTPFSFFPACVRSQQNRSPGLTPQRICMDSSGPPLWPRPSTYSRAGTSRAQNDPISLRWVSVGWYFIELNKQGTVWNDSYNTTFLELGVRTQKHYYFVKFWLFINPFCHSLFNLACSLKPCSYLISIRQNGFLLITKLQD